MSLLTDLISYWPLDEASGNALDIHGSNTLTDTNTVGSAAGIINNGRDFESGSSEYFTVADNASLRLGDIEALFAAWVKLESKSAAMAIASKWDTSSNREWELLYFNTPDRFQFQISTSGSNSVTVTANNLGSPSTGVWYYIVGEHDPTANELRIRVNNGTPDITSHSGGVRSGTSAFRIGSRSSSGIPFDGIIDEAGLWKRLWTSDEHAYMFNSGAGRRYADFDPASSKARNLLLMGAG